MRPAELNACIGVEPGTWTDFAAHWEDLVPDPYAAELGTKRLRRHGDFRFVPADGSTEPMPHDTFAKDRLLQRILALLGQLATALGDVSCAGRGRRRGSADAFAPSA